MVGDTEGEVRMGDLGAALPQLVEGMKRALVHKVPIDPQQRLPVLAGYDGVTVPELVEQGPRTGGVLRHLALPNALSWFMSEPTSVFPKGRLDASEMYYRVYR